jgi:hypothetical protein
MFRSFPAGCILVVLLFLPTWGQQYVLPAAVLQVVCIRVFSCLAWLSKLLGHHHLFGCQWAVGVCVCVHHTSKHGLLCERGGVVVMAGVI